MSAFFEKLKKLSFLSLPLCFLSFVLLDFSFRYFYDFVSDTDLYAWQPLWFTLCWSLLMTALIALLPRLIRRIVMLVVQVFFLCVGFGARRHVQRILEFLFLFKPCFCGGWCCIFQLGIHKNSQAVDYFCRSFSAFNDCGCFIGSKI